MQVLKFDAEGTISCPMNETATRDDCFKCNYRKRTLKIVNGNLVETCIYEDVFPELKDFAGLEDCIYIRGTE